MKIKLIKEICEEFETKNFQFESIGGHDILYTAVILDDNDDALVYWTSDLQKGKMLHMWYPKEKVEEFIKDRIWKVVNILDK